MYPLLIVTPFDFMQLLDSIPRWVGLVLIISLMIYFEFIRRRPETKEEREEINAHIEATYQARRARILQWANGRIQTTLAELKEQLSKWGQG